MKKFKIFFILILFPIICNATNDWKIFGSYSVLDDISLNFNKNVVNFRLMLGSQSPNDFIILATSFEVCFFDWKTPYRIYANDWRCGAFVGLNPLNFFQIHNSIINPYIVLDLGGTILYNENNPSFYYGSGIRISIGKEIIKFFIQEIIGSDYRLYTKNNLPGHKLEIGIEINIDYK